MQLGLRRDISHIRRGFEGDLACEALLRLLLELRVRRKTCLLLNVDRVVCIAFGYYCSSVGLLER